MIQRVERPRIAEISSREYELVMPLQDEQRGRKARGEILAAAEDDAESVNDDDTQCCTRYHVGSRVKSYQIPGERDCGSNERLGREPCGRIHGPLADPAASREVYFAGVSLALQYSVHVKYFTWPSWAIAQTPQCVITMMIR